MSSWRKIGLFDPCRWRKTKSEIQKQEKEEKLNLYVFNESLFKEPEGLDDPYEEPFQPIKAEMYYSTKLTVRSIILENIEQFVFLTYIIGTCHQRPFPITNFQKWFHSRKHSDFYTFNANGNKNVLNRKYIIDYSIVREVSNTEPSLG